jgi:NADP-dependent 3-hydroxy acid dehydrogenase YdfG
MSEAERSNPRFIMVTGASSGIGRATAAHLAGAGHVIFAAGRRTSALQALAAEHLCYPGRTARLSVRRCSG